MRQKSSHMNARKGKTETQVNPGSAMNNLKNTIQNALTRRLNNSLQARTSTLSIESDEKQPMRKTISIFKTDGR